MLPSCSNFDGSVLLGVVYVIFYSMPRIDGANCVIADRQLTLFLENRTSLQLTQL